ncbi:hypothetical protein [Candidatus Nitronereus thalassa]|uniref:Uncharacterized protein n=1 Tax=Candidatus Nitronereus thalassa TaxID=3020898 RepID=A0ABU3K7B3_9BACT|nr:hypothetical protein [Candidatus Nitronereus thalassa]MDT7042218.1 hypothetical protein [Candidatus Nitronereus thalassa]
MLEKWGGACDEPFDRRPGDGQPRRAKVIAPKVKPVLDPLPEGVSRPRPIPGLTILRHVVTVSGLQGDNSGKDCGGTIGYFGANLVPTVGTPSYFRIALVHVYPLNFRCLGLR